MSLSELTVIVRELETRQKLPLKKHQELAAKERPALKARLEKRMREAGVK